MTTPMDKTASRLSDERLAEMIADVDAVKAATFISASESYDIHPVEFLDALTELQSLRSLSSDSVSDGSKGVSDELASAIKRIQEALDMHDAEVADHLANESERADLWTDMDVLVSDVRTILSALALALDSGTGGHQPVAWHHRLIHTKGYDFDSEVTESEEHPFGKPGRDYDASFSVISRPLYSSPTEPKAGVVSEETRAFIDAVQLVEDAGWIILRPQCLRNDAGDARAALPNTTGEVE